MKLSGIRFNFLLKLINDSVVKCIGNYSPIYKSTYFAKNTHVLVKQYSSYINKPQTVSLDYDYLCDRSNTEHIKENILQRKCDANIEEVISLWTDLKTKHLNDEERKSLEKRLEREALKIPNRCSPHLFKYGDASHVLKKCNEKPSFKFKPKEFHDLVEHLNLLNRSRHLSIGAGFRSYILEGDLADLERALIRYTVSILLKKGFTLFSVPDLLYSDIIESCGMDTKSSPSQVYHLKNSEYEDVCLSGTSEMALGGYLSDTVLAINELPLKMAAVSRCYRQEIGNLSKEKGIYRVNEFTKVEMFGVTADETGEESHKLYQELIDIQMEIYSPLGFHFQVLDMPVSELGQPAYAKTDIEAWMPVRKHYGEISSASLCLDYQSRRLNLKYKNESGDLKFAHTVNGTACAVPRLLMTTVASHQTPTGTFTLPKVLQPFMGGHEVIQRRKGEYPPQISHFNKRQYAGTIVKAEEFEGN